MILVTGGLGYIGKHLIYLLLDKGYDIVIIDNLINSSIDTYFLLSKNKNNLIYYQIDIRDNLDSVFINNKIDCVIHLAGLKNVLESMTNSTEYFSVNLQGTKNLINTMLRYNVYKLIFSSTSCVYGNLPLPDNGYQESSFIKYGLIPNNYGKSKYLAEEFIKTIQIKNDNFQAVILRYFNPFNDNPILGKNIDTNLYSMIIKVINKEQKELLIYGKHHKTRDGTCIRDFIDINDLCNYHLNIIKYMKTNDINGIYNIGTGKGMTVLELIKYCEKTLSVNIPFRYVDNRLGDVSTSFANTDKIHNKIKMII